MKGFKVFCAAAVATIALAANASAQTFSPDGARTLSKAGGVAFSDGLTGQCSGLTGTATVSGGGGSITSLAISGGGYYQICSATAFSGFPYPITVNSTTSVTINNVVVQTAIGRCAGNIAATFDNATSQIKIVGARLPSTSGGTYCLFSAIIQVSPTATIVP